MAMKLTKKKAVELSIKKWRYILSQCPSKVNGLSGHNDDIVDAAYGDIDVCIPELKDLRSHCGLCEYYNMDCVKCELESCMNDNLWYSTWWNMPTKKNAKKVLKKLKSIKV
jgi:hypothetical protein